MNNEDFKLKIKNEAYAYASKDTCVSDSDLEKAVKQYKSKVERDTKIKHLCNDYNESFEDINGTFCTKCGEIFPF